MKIKLGVLFLLSFLLIGCNQQSLYSGLSEQEANEMVALLYNAGIVAKKQSQSDQSYAVSVPNERFSQSVELLKANGYPRNEFKSLGDVFQKEGFVSSPLEERARLNYAQSQELTRTLESIDGVVLARVHLALPEDDPLTSEQKPSSASVFIKHRRGIDLSSRESQIKALVVNSVEGLPYDNITVALFPSEAMPTNYAPLPQPLEATTNVLSPLVLGLLGLVVILCVAIATVGWKYFRPNQAQLTKAANEVTRVKR